MDDDSLDPIGAFIKKMRRAHEIAEKKLEVAAIYLEEDLAAHALRRADIQIAEDGKIIIWLPTEADPGVERKVKLTEMIDRYIEKHQWIDGSFSRSDISSLADLLKAEAARLMALPFKDRD